METAYGPFILELTRRLERDGVQVPEATVPGPASSADDKRRLLQAAVDRFGLPYLETLGRSVAGLVGHPFVSSLRATTSAAELLGRWQRLEVLAHSGNRVAVTDLGRRHVRLTRMRRTGGPPTLAEDTLIAGTLAGLLEAVGATEVQAHDEGENAEPLGRSWRLEWTGWEPPAAAPPPEPWGTVSDFARAAFAVLLDDPGLPLAALARALHVSTRSLQRRLQEAGTSFQSLVRMARIALAGGTLLRAGRALPTLTSVAHACGFSDSAPFTREFQALVAISPRRFASALAGREAAAAHR